MNFIMIGLKTNDMEKLKEQLFEEALQLIQYFTDRVEEGTIRSKTTYKKYKDFLALVEDQLAEFPRETD